MRIRIRHISRAGIAAGALVIACHCAVATATPDIEKLENSLVRVIVGRGDGLATGSGFVLNSNGQIATNHHVVESHTRIAVYFSGSGDLHPARTLWSSAELDLAVIEIEGSRWIPMPLTRSIPKKGAPVYALGFPGDADAISEQGVAMDATVTGGVLSRTFMGAWQRRELLLLQHSADINPGNSGGPLLDECGRVIGVNTSGASVEVADADGNPQTVPVASGLFWASSIRELTAALNNQSIRYVSDASECPGDEVASGVASTNSGGNIGKERSMGLDSGWIVFASLLSVVLLFAVALLTWQVRRQGLRLATLLPQFGRPLTREKKGTPPPSGGLIAAGFQSDGQAIRIALPKADIANRPHGVVLGRHPMLVDTAIDSPEISRRHLRFEYEAGGFTVQDLNSTNGSQLNGRALKPYHPRRVRAGDRIALGIVELRVSAL